MRKSITDTITQRLDNGLAVKGSYSFSMSGLHVSVHVVSPNGLLLHSVNTTVKGHPHYPDEILREEVGEVFGILKQYSALSKMYQDRVLASVVPELIKRQRRTRAQRHAAA